MSVKIKICGLVSAEDAVNVSESGADMAGMVLFFPKSKRNVSISQAKEIMSALSDNVKKYAVTVSPDAEQVREISEAGFDILQVHGELSDEAYEASAIPIVKAFNVTDIDMLDKYSKLDKVTDANIGRCYIWAITNIVFANTDAFSDEIDKRIPFRNHILHNGIYQYSDNEISQMYFVLLSFIKNILIGGCAIKQEFLD